MNMVCHNAAAKTECVGSSGQIIRKSFLKGFQEPKQKAKENS